MFIDNKDGRLIIFLTSSDAGLGPRYTKPGLGLQAGKKTEHTINTKTIWR